VSLQQLTGLQDLFKYQSGRVIALGRLILGTMFLLAATLDRSETHLVWLRTFTLLTLYSVAALIIAVAIWRNWWLDARLAVVTHLGDMAVFTAVVFSSNSTTSPFFLFFVLPLLSAAIRWSWRETALTATALIVLFMIAALFITGTETLELERFILRAGNLLILTLLFMWFGINQRANRLFFRVDDESDGLEDHDSLVRALALTIRVSQASGGALMIAPSGEEACEGVRIAGDKPRAFSTNGPLVRYGGYSSFLFDVPNDRAITRQSQGHFHFAAASALLNLGEGQFLGEQGLVVEVRTGTLQGWLLLWGIPDLSTDFIDLGPELGRAVGAILDRRALLDAIEAGAAARTRLSLARDVHDGIVQFLAGAAIRVEAIKRASKGGAKVGGDLDELKRLLVEEQGEIRGFLLALRRDRELELAEAVAELRALAERLSQQWSVDCSVTGNDQHASIPIRLQLDLQQMLREAVANAVRHGGAKKIDVGLAVENDRLQVSVVDNGSGFQKKNGEAAAEPLSLKERVERANGSIRLVSEPGSTNILISLPLAGAVA
jgi:signal transduction histidine kinase